MIVHIAKVIVVLTSLVHDHLFVCIWHFRFSFFLWSVWWQAIYWCLVVLCDLLYVNRKLTPKVNQSNILRHLDRIQLTNQPTCMRADNIKTSKKISSIIHRAKQWIKKICPLFGLFLFIPFFGLPTGSNKKIKNEKKISAISHLYYDAFKKKKKEKITYLPTTRKKQADQTKNFFSTKSKPKHTNTRNGKPKKQASKVLLGFCCCLCCCCCSMLFVTTGPFITHTQHYASYDGSNSQLSTFIDH